MQDKTHGYVHSIDSFGAVDGPGIRLVVFMQGCPMRCLYCHNPDTWKLDSGKKTSPEEIIAEYLKNKEFYTKGGITVTGGEPLLQIDFLTELFNKAKALGIHTCIDTSGITYREDGEYIEKLDRLIEKTDLVLLDIKHIDSKKHKALCGTGNENVLAFARYLEEKNVPVCIRHVVLRGYTDSEDDLFALGEFIGKLKSVKMLDVLPYHTLGKSKYAELGLEYPLKNIAPTTSEESARARKSILRGIASARKNKRT